MNKEKNNYDVSKKNTKSGHFKMIIFLSILVIVIIGAEIIYFYAQKPAQGTIKLSSSGQDLETKNNNVSEAFAGKYLSFFYGNSYVLKSHNIDNENGAVILEQAYLSENSAISKKIGLTIRSLPTHNLEDCPDFKMREINSKKYKKDNFDFSSVSGSSFEAIDQGTFEKTFFLLHGDYLAIISMSAPSLSDEEIEDEASGIVKSVSWLK